MPKLFTVKELAALFQKDEDTIRCWIKEGIFPSAFKIKDGWYIPLGDIKKMMRQKAEPSDSSKSRQDHAHRHSAGFVNNWK